MPSIVDGTVDLSEVSLETQDSQTIDGGTATATGSVAAAFDAAVTAQYGADGEGSTAISGYALTLGDIDHGLESNGEPITFSLADGVITGSTTAGEVLRLEVDSDGNVTVTQSAALDHAEQGADSLSLPTGLVGVEATVTVTDGDGDTTSETLSADLGDSISIVDDMPIAMDDVDTVAEGTAEGNVITAEGTLNEASADDVGADGGQVTSVSFGETTVSVPTDGSAEIDGEFGTLTLNADGSYTYAVDPDKLPQNTKNVEGWEKTDSNMTAFNLGESFLDADGKFNDTGTGSVTSGGAGFGVGGTSGANTSVPSQINYSGSLSEALAFKFDGSVLSATVQFSNLYQDERGGEAMRWHAFDADGNRLDSGIVSDNGASEPYANNTDADFNGSGNNKGSFTISDIGAFSTLVFEAVPYGNDGSANADDSDFFVNISEYESFDQADNSYQDQFDYTIVDGDGDSASATLTLNGDAEAVQGELTPLTPVAVGNTYEVDGVTEGNIITDDDDNGGAQSGRDYDNDTPVLNLSIHSVIFNGQSTLVESDDTVINLNNGTLSINLDGSYTYTPNENANGGDVFEYTLIDPDGEISNAATVTLEFVDHPVEITGLTPKADGGDVVIDEDDLPAGRGGNKSPGSDGSDSTTATGTFYINAPDGVGSLTVGGQAVITNGTFTPVSFESELGNTLSITGYNEATGEISYEYTLEDNTVTHGPESNGENSVFENFDVNLTDTDGDQATDILSVQIVDDIPEFDEEGIEDASLSTDVGSEATGDLNLEIGADFEGAQMSGATLKQDEDGYIQVQYEEGGATQSAFLTSGGSKLQYEFDQDSQQLIAFKQGDSSSNPVFTIDFDVTNGSYEINVIEALDPVTVGFENAGVTSNGGGTGLALELDGADLNAVFTMQDGGNVNWSNTGIGGSPNNLIGNGDVLVANFDHVLTELSFTASRGVGNPQTAEWKVYLDGEEVGSGTGNNITGIEGGFDEVQFIGHGQPNDQYRVNDFGGRYQDSSIDYQLPVELDAVDGDGDTTDSGFTIGFDPESSSIELPEPEEPAAPSITGGEVLINETWLSGGTREGQGDTTQEGSIQLSAEGGIASLTVGGETLDFAALQDLGNSPVSIQIDGIGTLSLTGFQGTDTGGTLSYELALNDNVNHDDVQGRNNEEFNIDLGIVDFNGESDSGTLELVVQDDVPESESETPPLDVVIDEFGIDDIGGNWVNASGGNSSVANYLVSNGIGIVWGGSDFDDASGYKFEYANEFDAESSIVSGDPLSLGTFTHVNNPISTGNAIDEVTLSLKVDTMLNGEMFSIPVEVVLVHDETSNDKNRATHRDNDDFITIKEFSVDQGALDKLAAAGYQFSIDGFKDDEDNLVKTVRTTETESTSFDLFASVQYVGEPATAEGTISADWGADGPAEIDPIVVEHANGNSAGLDAGQAMIEGAFGTLTLTDDGNGEFSYDYVLNQEGRQELKSEGNLTESFSYTLKDGDGDQVSRDITLNLTGVAPPIELVDLVDQVSVNSTSEESTKNFEGISANINWTLMWSASDSKSLQEIFTVADESSGSFSFTTHLSDSSSGSSFNWELSRLNGGEWEIYDVGASDKAGLSSVNISDLPTGEYRFEADVNVSSGWFSEGKYASVYDLTFVQTTDGLETHGAKDNLFDDSSVFLGSGDIELTMLGADPDGNNVLVDAADTEIAGRFGKLTISPDGTYDYQPEASTDHLGGVEQFEYQVTNSDTGQSATATLSIQIDSDDFNVIFGTEVGETLEGSDGLDVLVGGAGDDTLTGGDGDDVFRWNFGDEGVDGQPAEDTVTDFGNGNDKLDLSDLLQGEDSGNINEYIFAEEDGDNVVLSISSEGNLNGSTSAADQKITLEGKSFNDFGVNSGLSEDLIAKLVEDGQLKIDQ
nr:DUF5801 repeats-in-toxin domain-containing protein [Halomonas sp. CSM-2]